MTPALTRTPTRSPVFAHQAYQSITYRDWVPLAMAESKLVLRRRVPDGPRLAWAKVIVERMGNRGIPNSVPEVYAKEAIFLHEEPRRELKLQAIRIGELGIAAIPNEVFALTGLKIKAWSPFETTMNIELANGSEGYVPPPEQHVLGGLHHVAGSYRRAGGRGRDGNRRDRTQVARTGRGQTATELDLEPRPVRQVCPRIEAGGLLAAR